MSFYLGFNQICRVISGLNPSSVAGITCTATGLKITITGFAPFTSQEVQIKIFATNPPESRIFRPFTIKTFSSFDVNTVNYKQIDSNDDAGEIQISEIQRPYFVAIDLYRKMANLTLDSIGPIDFRLYPT